MELKYSLTKSDYLTYQLFQASQSKHLRKIKSITWFLIPLLYIAIGIIGIVNLIISIGGSILWLIIFPYFTRWAIKNNYSKLINEQLGDQIDKTRKISLENNKILLSDETSERKIDTSEVSGIFEIANHVFIRLQQGVSIILPKDKIAKENVASFVSALENQTGINKTEMLDWKWK